MRGSEFVFDSIDLLHYNLHKISLNRGGSYIDYPKWLKKATIYIYIYTKKMMIVLSICCYCDIKL